MVNALAVPLVRGPTIPKMRTLNVSSVQQELTDRFSKPIFYVTTVILFTFCVVVIFKSKIDYNLSIELNTFFANHGMEGFDCYSCTYMMGEEYAKDYVLDLAGSIAGFKIRVFESFFFIAQIK